MSLAFDFLWGFLLLPLPLAMRWLPPARIERDALWVPFFAGLEAVHAPASDGMCPRRRAVLAWLLLVAALTQPVIVTETATWALYRPLLAAALLLAAYTGLSLTRRPRATRRLPDRYYRGEQP